MVLTQLIFAQTKNMIITNTDGSEYSFSIADIDSIIFSDERDAIIDVDGNTYLTVKIGNQWWMAENLRVTHYRDSSAIPEVTDNDTWLQATSGARCYYNNLATYHGTYGCLYNWYAVGDSRGLAPEGWHIPSRAEYEELCNYVGIFNYRKLRSKSGWDSDNGTDDYSFTALPAGFRYEDGGFEHLGEYSRFWTSTIIDEAYYFAPQEPLEVDLNIILRGFSVRCVKDAE